MKTLINNKNLVYDMPEESERLEERIPGLLNRAISLMPRKGIAIKLFRESDFLCEVDGNGVIKYWKERHPEGSVTRWENITREEFLDWVGRQPHNTKQEVYHNLQDYINTETSKERGEIGFPESQYPLGY